MSSFPAAPPRNAMVRARPVLRTNSNDQSDFFHRGSGYSARATLAVLGRHKAIIVLCTSLLTLAAAATAFMLPPSYVAESLIILDTRRAEIVQQPAVLSNLVSGSLADPAIVRSEVDLISSPAYARKIIDRLDLLNNPEFQRETKPSAWSRVLRDMHGLIDRFAPFLRTPPPPARADAAISRAIGVFSRHLNVYNDGKSYAIRLRYDSRDPELAAMIVNTIAGTYLSDQVETKRAASRQASEWLRTRLKALQADVQQNERVLAEFEEQHHLATVINGNMAEQQLHELNMQLMAASNDRQQKQAVLTQVQAMLKSPGGAAAAAQVLASPLIQKLREQEAQAAGQLDPRGQSRAQEIGRRISAEIQRVIASLAGEVSASETRENALQSEIAQLGSKLNSMNAARIRQRDLERDATASRNLYDGFFARLQQVEADEQAQQADARVVRAEPPMLPSFPNKPLLIGFGFFGSLFLGVVLAFAAEQFDETVRSPEDAERLTGAPAFGIVPLVRSTRRALALVTEAPLSAYSDAIRDVLVALRAGAPYGTPCVIAVSSALPSEGKTTLAATIGRAAAAAGARTLLIDCDMRRPAVGSLFSAQPSPTLESMFAEKSLELPHFVAKDEASGLHYLPTRAVTTSPQEVLGSQWMTELIATARASYDLVVLDTPPLLTMSDALPLSRLSDTTLLVVRWSRTQIGFVTEALRLLQRHGGGAVGIVLSMVSMRSYVQSRGVGYGYGKPNLRRLMTGSVH